MVGATLVALSFYVDELEGKVRKESAGPGMITF